MPPWILKKSLDPPEAVGSSNSKKHQKKGEQKLGLERNKITLIFILIPNLKKKRRT